MSQLRISVPYRRWSGGTASPRSALAPGYRPESPLPQASQFSISEWSATKVSTPYSPA